MPATFRPCANLVMQELTEVMNKMDDSNVQPAIDLLKSANRIVCLSGGREGLALKFFAMRLMHLGKDTHWALDDTCPPLRRGDVFICSGGAGLPSHVMYITEQAKKTGAGIVVVTAVADSPLGRLADAVLLIPATAYLGDEKLDVVQTRQQMGSLYEQSEVLVFDVVSAMMQAQMGLSDEDMEARHRNFE